MIDIRVLAHLIGFKDSLPDQDVGKCIEGERQCGGDDRAVFFHRCMCSKVSIIAVNNKTLTIQICRSIPVIQQHNIVKSLHSTYSFYTLCRSEKLSLRCEAAT